MTGPADADRRLAPVIRLAPAKVNLTLAVLGSRADGYHDLHSVMVPIGLADRLSLSVLPPGMPDALHVDGFDPGPAADNLVLRAIAAARRHAAAIVGRQRADAVPRGAPRQAHPGRGGSRRRHRRTRPPRSTRRSRPGAWTPTPTARLRIAAELGSDVPFFLAGGPALVEGRGERVTPLGWLRDAPADGARPGLLIVTPDAGISTPAAFAAFDAGARPGAGAARLASTHLADELRKGLRVADLLARAGVLAAANDLAPAASVVEPGLVPFKRALLRLLARPVGLSGSGPTHWAIYPSREEAEAAADRVREAYAGGQLPAPGTRAPFVLATTILAGAGDPGRHP